MSGPGGFGFPAAARGASSALRRYEVRVRTVVSAALVASLPIRATRTPAHRHSTQLVRVSRQRHITDVVGLLADRGVEVLDIRTVDATDAATQYRPLVHAAGRRAAP